MRWGHLYEIVVGLIFGQGKVAPSVAATVSSVNDESGIIFKVASLIKCREAKMMKLSLCQGIMSSEVALNLRIGVSSQEVFEPTG